MHLELLMALLVLQFVSLIEILAAKIRQFSVFLPEIEINRQHLLAAATDLERMLFTLEPGYGNLFHHPAKGTVQSDHIIGGN